MYNKSYPEADKSLIGQATRVRFANADNVAEVSIDGWFENNLTSIDNDTDQVDTQVFTSSNFNDGEEEESAKLHYLCRSKGSETPTPINLHFPAKTCVIIVDRRKTDNG